MQGEDNWSIWWTELKWKISHPTSNMYRCRKKIQQNEYNRKANSKQGRCGKDGHRFFTTLVERWWLHITWNTNFVSTEKSKIYYVWDTQFANVGKWLVSFAGSSHNGSEARNSTLLTQFQYWMPTVLRFVKWCLMLLRALQTHLIFYNERFIKVW